MGRQALPHMSLGERFPLIAGLNKQVQKLALDLYSFFHSFLPSIVSGTDALIYEQAICPVPAGTGLLKSTRRSQFIISPSRELDWTGSERNRAFCKKKISLTKLLLISFCCLKYLGQASCKQVCKKSENINFLLFTAWLSHTENVPGFYWQLFPPLF